MTIAVLYKLLSLVLVVGLGWLLGRLRWLGEPGRDGNDPSRVLSNVAFYLFVPALLFRTTARLDVASLPWLTLAGFFVPLLALTLLVYGVQRWREAAVPERPSVRAIIVSFGNTLQVGVPVAAGVFGEAGLPSTSPW